MALSMDSLARIALDLQWGISTQDRFQQLVNSLRQLLLSDALALLRYEDQHFRPLATDGLAPDVLGRRFRLGEHPRLEAIARAGDVVRFPADSQLPDPYDNLILPSREQLKVHACIGLPLVADQTLIGALTIDGYDPAQFDGFDDEELRLIGALAAAALSNALLVERLERQTVAPIGAGAPSRAGADEIVGMSPGMVQLKREIAVVAGSELNVLIMGETGVGKELVAKAIHQGSPRAARPLVYLNCAALPESVAESELFGHVKGAFTGATHHRAGKFEIADQGTLFLDEIGELSLTLQAKLLRVLQYGDLQRIGDDRSLKVDVRILAATNRDLKAAVLANEFRADLYHRLSVFPLTVPALRERAEDIALLSGLFCERCRSQLGLSSLALSKSALAMLQRYPWPGNVRELEHAIHRAAVLARADQGGGDVRLSSAHFNLDTPAEAAPSPSPPTPGPLPAGGLREAVDEFQAGLIRQTLARCEGNWSAAARHLGVNSANLHRLARRLMVK